MATRQQRIIPSRSNLSDGGAALSPAKAKMAIPAQETIALRMVPKTKTIPPSQASSKPDRRMGKLALTKQAMDGDSEDDNYMPLSEDEVSLGDEEFIMPEDPVEQERFKRRLIATAKSLKKNSYSYKLIKIC